jgi:hypothetical protein
LKKLFYKAPIELLVAHSNIVVNWHSQLIQFPKVGKLYLSGLHVLSTHLIALLATLIWLAIGFPSYIDSIFLSTFHSGWIFLNESILHFCLLAALLILAVIILGAEE